MTVGRPKRGKDEVVEFRVRFWMIRGDDDDLIAKFEGWEPKQRWGRVKELIRAGDPLAWLMEGEDDDLIEQLADLPLDELWARLKTSMRAGDPLTWLVKGEDDDLIEQLADLPLDEMWKRIKILMRSGITDVAEGDEDADLKAGSALMDL